MYPCHKYPCHRSSSYILEVVALRAALLLKALFGSRSFGEQVLLMVEEGREESVDFQPFFFPLYFCRPLLFSRALFLVTRPSGQNLGPGFYIPWLLLSTLYNNIQLP